MIHTVRKAYYRLSRQIHSDRVAESEKEEATEKFKILAKIHGVLVDTEKKKLYDLQAIIDDDIDNDSDCNWLNYFRECFKLSTTVDIGNFSQNYIGKIHCIEMFLFL